MMMMIIMMMMMMMIMMMMMMMQATGASIIGIIGGPFLEFDLFRYPPNLHKNDARAQMGLGG